MPRTFWTPAFRNYARVEGSRACNCRLAPRPHAGSPGDEAQLSAWLGPCGVPDVGTPQPPRPRPRCCAGCRSTPCTQVVGVLDDAPVPPARRAAGSRAHTSPAGDGGKPALVAKRYRHCAKPPIHRPDRCFAAASCDARPRVPDVEFFRVPQRACPRRDGASSALAIDQVRQMRHSRVATAGSTSCVVPPKLHPRGGSGCYHHCQPIVGDLARNMHPSASSP